MISSAIVPQKKEVWIMLPTLKIIAIAILFLATIGWLIKNIVTATIRFVRQKDWLGVFIVTAIVLPIIFFVAIDFNNYLRLVKTLFSLILE